MRAWHIVRTRLRSLVCRGGRESDLNEELRLHLEREIERLQANGLSPDDARTQARRLFGSVEQIKEECRDARGAAAIDALVRDLRYGLRRLIRDWRFTTATRPQLIRHLLTESLLLSLAGGTAGCLLAWWAMRALQRVDLPVTVDLTG